MRIIITDSGLGGLSICANFARHIQKYKPDPYLNADTIAVEFEVGESDTEPPSPPILISILQEGNGFILKWIGNTENDLAGYRLYFSYEMDTWFSNHDETYLTSTDTQFQVGSFFNNTGFFRMTAVDNAPVPNESEPSDIFVFRRRQGGQKLLFINSTHQQSNTPNLPFTGNAGLLADSHNIGIGTLNDTIFSTDTSFIIPENYLPIVLTGNSTKQFPNDLIEQLENSSFWIMGSKSSESLTMSTTGSNFLQNYLGVYFTESFPIPSETIGIGAPYENFASTLILTAGIDSLNSIGSPLNESIVHPIFTDSTGLILGVGMITPSSLLSSIPLEILNDEDQIDYFNRAIEFLLDTTLTTNNDIILPTKLTLTFYPNPFNSRGLIQINGIQGNYYLNLYNILGQSVWNHQLIKLNSTPITFNLPNNISKGLTSGPYFLHLSIEGQNTITQKILYIK